MRCGRCKATGVTVDSVRRCYNGESDAHQLMSDAEETRLIQAKERAEDERAYASKPDYREPDNGVIMVPRQPASPEMKKYVFDLQDERVLPEQWTLYTDESLSLLERVEVHGIINSLKVLPKKATGSNTWTMPAGRYALYKPGPDDEPGAYSYVDRQDLVPPSYGKWTFYEVDHGKGRWAGYTFLTLLVGAPGTYKKFKVRNASERNALLRRIEDDPKKAMLDYGLQSAECGRCHSPLTDPESIKRGIGPKCATKSGWF